MYSNPGDVAHIKNERRDLQKQRNDFGEKNEALALLQYASDMRLAFYVLQLLSAQTDDSKRN